MAGPEGRLLLVRGLLPGLLRAGTGSGARPGPRGTAPPGHSGSYLRRGRLAGLGGAAEGSGEGAAHDVPHGGPHGHAGRRAGHLRHQPGLRRLRRGHRSGWGRAAGEERVRECGGRQRSPAGTPRAAPAPTWPVPVPPRAAPRSSRRAPSPHNAPRPPRAPL